MRCFAFGIAALVIAGTVHAEKTDLQLAAKQGVAHFFTLSKPWAADQDYIERTARAFCQDKPICRVHFWEKGTAKPKGYPMTDREIDSELASYLQNRNTGLSQMNLSCKAFPKLPKNKCFS